MVADPRDLVIGRPLGPQDADAASLAIQRYREGKTSPLSGVTAASTYTIAPLAPGGAGGATSGSGL
jgi:type IV pilus biogenesis protein CpaD/CtpE